MLWRMGEGISSRCCGRRLLAANPLLPPIPMRGEGDGCCHLLREERKKKRREKDDYRGAKSFGNSCAAGGEAKRAVCIFHVWEEDVREGNFFSSSPLFPPADLIYGKEEEEEGVTLSEMFLSLLPRF